MQENLIERNIFAFYMSMNPLDDDSELIFGSYDEDRFIGNLNWHLVINKLFWSLKLDDIKIRNVSTSICENVSCMVTPDSGTSLSTMP